MIQLKDLDLEMTEVLDNKLESVVGGLFGGTYFKLPSPIVVDKPATPNQYNTPSIIPTLPVPGSYTPDGALQNFGVSGSDGKGNIFEVGPGRASYEYNGNGAGVFWNSDTVGGAVKVQY